MSTLVMKFGGAAVASIDQFTKIAQLIISYRALFDRIVVVVSAMGDTTDHLISLAHQVNPTPPKREYDMLLSIGERISCSLLAMKLAAFDQKAASFTGSQAGIITSCCHTNARILTVRPHRLLKVLDAGSIAIVAGFQGMSEQGEITTLGRGGSDTTAVALALALDAEKVLFFKDVAGIFAEDPKEVPAARCFEQLSYEAALQVIQKGAQVLHERSLHLAAKNGLLLHVRSFCPDEPHPGTQIADERPRVSPAQFEELL